jgi:hypothetical protein
MKIPFLFQFRTPLPEIERDPCEGSHFDDRRQCQIGADGSIVWHMASRYPTSCYTSGRVRKGYYNRKGRYLPSKYIPGRTDRRAGR